MSKGRLNSGNYKKFPKEWVSGGWHILLGEGRDEGSVSGRENRADKSGGMYASMVCEGNGER